MKKNCTNDCDFYHISFMMGDMTMGRIIFNGVKPEKHEMDTILFLTEQGYDVELIPLSTINGVRTPDIMISGIAWEMKSPRGHGRWVLENALRKAVKQSLNIIKECDILKVDRICTGMCEP